MEVICSYLFNTDWYSKTQTLIKCDPGPFFGATVARSVARLLWNVVHCIAWAVRRVSFVHGRETLFGGADYVRCPIDKMRMGF